jgi:hypothetical protein
MVLDVVGDCVEKVGLAGIAKHPQPAGLLLSYGGKSHASKRTPSVAEAPRQVSFESQKKASDPASLPA